MLRLAVLSSLILAAMYAQTPSKPFTEYDGDEFLQTFPDLAGMHFSTGQNQLDAVLRVSGEKLNTMLAGFPAVSAREQIHELRFDKGGGVTNGTENFRYSARYKLQGSEAVLDEFRTDPASGERAAPPIASNFLVLSHFEALLNYFLPENRQHSEFRYLGRLREGGRDFTVFAFVQRPDSKLPSHVVTGEGGRTARIHGLAWIDAETSQISRLHVEMVEQIANFPFETLSTDIVFVPVGFRAVDGESWLPARVTVHARFGGGEVHTVHRFTNYRLTDEDGDSANGTVKPTVDDAREDAFEVLARGITLAGEHDLNGAISAMRESVRQSPESALVRFHLSAALHSAGDAAGAEAEIREGLKRCPGDGSAHNSLAVLLLKRGDLQAAIYEFGVSARLQPKSAVVRFNLGQALERMGNIKGATEAYQEAATLDPNNTNYRARLERIERDKGTANETTFRVDVRQVLVPAIATDSQGHHAVGLKQTDFRIYEDGVEQTITSFNSETVGSEQPAETHPESSQTNVTVPVRDAVRRTYVVCIDTLHTAMSSLMNARTALEKLFRAERAGDAQYVLVAVGGSTEILANTTQDPARVMRSLEEQGFHKHLLASRRGAAEFDLSRFRHSLDQAKRSCDVGDPSCASRKRALPIQADQIAMQERVYNLAFLSQLGSVVEQLSHGSDRRTLVLISDGFNLVPGKEAHELLRAYFPEFRSAALASVDRMQFEFEKVVRLASKSNITIHTVDARGLYVQSYFEASNAGSAASVMPAALSVMNQSASDAQATLSEVAAATGGIAFKNNNDVFRGLTRAFADGREYYMLGYVSTNPKLDGTFRTISVRVRDPNLIVQAKRGYWATEK